MSASDGCPLNVKADYEEKSALMLNLVVCLLILQFVGKKLSQFSEAFVQGIYKYL